MDEIKRIDPTRTFHVVMAGEEAPDAAIDAALLYHLPIYEEDCSRRTRISVLFDNKEQIEDFIFEYKELFDNSFYRIVDLSDGKVKTTLHRPQYYGLRKDFVDVEWELIKGRISSTAVDEKISQWSNNPDRQLVVILCYRDEATNLRYAEKLRRRLPEGVTVVTDSREPETKERMEELTMLAKYLNYCYKMSFERGSIPAEFPEEEVEAAWEALPEERMRQSSIYNVKSIPFKMLVLGHDRGDWEKFYALTSKEIESLSALEHNRWTVERLIQGTRPCTDHERREIEEDFRRRASDPEYAASNPLTLKKKYARERGAHYDICAFSDLGEDETGLPVARYDRDLTQAIPLIVKTYMDRHE